MKKGYKVTDVKRQRMIGIACDNLIDLLEKGSRKLNINEKVRAVLNDGTIVDDEEYFQSLSPQTVFILHRKNEDIVTGVDFVLNVLRCTNVTYLNTGSMAKEILLNKAEELVKTLKEKKENDCANTREEDPRWFEGLETNAKTKDEFMNRKSQDRIRGYFYKFREDVRKSKHYLENDSFRKIIENCIEFFKKRLKSDGYFGCYFDRRCAATNNFLLEKGDGNKHKVFLHENEKRPKLEEDVESGKFDNYDRSSFCDGLGNFLCQGKWQMKKCEYLNEHSINPYSSRKNRLLFSTWNFDHSI